MKSGKGVLTASDSGGVLEFVRDGVTGYVVPPDQPALLAERIDSLYLDRELAECLGTAAQRIVAPITWDATIRRLTED
jgi:glycosyltransferase involved in cell wall biosynthesis